MKKNIALIAGGYTGESVVSLNSAAQVEKNLDTAKYNVFKIMVLGDGMGASEIDVPDLRGLTLSEAKFSIRGSSLTLGDVIYEGTITDSASAIIVNQTPFVQDSIIKVSIGTRINLILSNQP